MQPIKVSVITVVYNDSRNIEKTMRSVLSQTYANIEYIVIDGGSSDGTIDVIKSLEDELAYWHSKPDRGVYDAMNKGIAHATGDYVSFMNSGDSFYSETTIADVFSLIGNTMPEVIYGDAFMQYTSVKSFVRSYADIEPKKVSYSLCHQATFTKRSELKRYGFDVSFRIAADMNLFTTIYKHGGTFVYVPIVIANYEAEQGLSATSLWAMYKEYHRLLDIKPYTVIGLKVIVYDTLKALIYNLPFGLNKIVLKKRLKNLYKK